MSINRYCKDLFSGVILFIFLFIFSTKSFSWGFFSHRVINRHAVYCLPQGMLGFYKKHIEIITEHSIDPDKKSRAVKEEAPRHYIDIEYYGTISDIPVYRRDAEKKFSKDSLMRWGVLPWHISSMLFRLTDAFKEEDAFRILLLSARLAHYIADATTPLHTTKYYNGRNPSERGIHAFWETRIPELIFENLNLFVGKPVYIPNGQIKAWEIVKETHKQVDTVYLVYEQMLSTFPEDRVYVYETRGTVTKRNYSREFSEVYEKMSNNMVERNMRRAIFYTASYWYTAWVNAGQPDLDRLMDRDVIKESRKEKKEVEKMWKTGKAKERTY